MAPSFLRPVIDRLRQALPGGKSGSTMLWAIGALVVLGVAGATVALMSPAALQSKLEQEAGMRAYYNANAGLNYILGMQQAAQSSNLNLSGFIGNMGGGGVVIYNVGALGSFSYQLGNFNYNGAGGDYQITNLVGTAYDSSGRGVYGYVLYGGSKGSYTGGANGVPYNPGGNTNTTSPADYVIYSGNAAVTIGGAAKVVGDVYAKTLTVSQAEIDGNVITVGDANLGFATTIKGSLCSGGDVTLDQSSVSSTINAAGNVYLKYASTAGGNVYSGGYVKTDGSVKFLGDVNAQQYITTGWAAQLSKNAYANGNINFQGGSEQVAGSVYSGGTIALSWGTTIVGQAIGKKVTVVGGSSVGSYTETTSYPPNIKPTAPTTCRQDSNPPQKSFTNTSTKDVYLPWADTTYGKNNPLQPGSYRNLTSGDSVTITFKAGTYYFNSVSLGWATTINYDVSGGDILIFVTNDISIGGSSNMNVSTNGSTWSDMTGVATSYAAKVYWESHGNGTLGWGTNWFGTMFTAKTINLGGANNNVIGALVTSGTMSNIDWSANIVYVPANYALANW
ncbi:hypothetical protein [Solidesulfovibrio sp.]|uniref:hypothetical protein n=1 Tax=Solidesulfovibrio sp. TaxID=2910990 RepID=UPI0026360484|nr:hypothetical protein [Solidesulfovibrio sp.]